MAPESIFVVIMGAWPSREDGMTSWATALAKLVVAAHGMKEGKRKRQWAYLQKKKHKPVLYVLHWALASVRHTRALCFKKGGQFLLKSF